MRTTLCALAVSVLAGCGWKSDGLERLEQLYPTPPPPDAGMTGPIDIGTPMCSGYAGTWAVQVTQAGTIMPLAEPWDLTLHDLFLADSDGQTLTLRFCDEAAPITTSAGPTDLGKTKVPDALKAALHDAPLVIALPSDGSFHASDVVWLWGIHDLADPLNDALPDAGTYQSDPHVYDEDGDGQPGITMQVVTPMGDRYMLRRAVWQLEPGKLTFDNQWVTGVLSARVDQTVLGASLDLLLTPIDIKMKPTGSSYQLRCVGQTYTCPSLANDYLTLFKDAPK